MTEEENNARLDRLIRIGQQVRLGNVTNLNEEEFKHSERIKYAITVLLDYPHKKRTEHVTMLMNQFEISQSLAYRCISDANDIYPSIEKVNKEFERSRLRHITWKFLMICDEKKNTRDAPQYIKQLIELDGLRTIDEDGAGGVTIINNFLKYAPETLGIEMPPNFNKEEYIKKLEKEYEQRTIDVEHTEVK